MSRLSLLCILFVCIFQLSIGTTTLEVKRKASKLRSEGDTLLVSGDAIGALSKYAEAITLEPHEVKNYLKSYRANQRLKRLQASIKDLTLAIEHDIEKLELENSYLQRANLYLSLGRCFEALNDFVSVLAINPNHSEAIENRERMIRCVDMVERAEKLMEAEDFHEADRLFTEAIDQSRSAAPELKKKRAQARFHKGDHFECIADAGEVAKLDRNDVEMVTLRGRAYLQLGDLEMALRHA